MSYNIPGTGEAQAERLAKAVSFKQKKWLAVAALAVAAGIVSFKVATSTPDVAAPAAPAAQDQKLVP